MMQKRWIIWLLGLAVVSAQAEKISSSGITEPILDATLSSPVSGIIATQKVKEGEFVKGGETIIELDKRLEELEARRRGIILPPMKTDLEGTKFLFQQPKSSISKEVLDKKQSDYDVASLEHDLADEAVRKRLIVAPFDGYVAEIFIKVGEACQIQQPVVRLVDTRRCYFISNVEAKRGYALKTGQIVDLEVDAGAQPIHFSATISFISPVADPASGLMKVKAVFENPDGKIRPGVAGKMIFADTKNAGQ